MLPGRSHLILGFQSKYLGAERKTTPENYRNGQKERFGNDKQDFCGRCLLEIFISSIFASSVKDECITELVFKMKLWKIWSSYNVVQSKAKQRTLFTTVNTYDGIRLWSVYTNVSGEPCHATRQEITHLIWSLERGSTLSTHTHRRKPLRAHMRTDASHSVLRMWVRE